MKLSVLIREALRSSWAAKVPTILMGVVVAAMCFVALATVGREAANAADVQTRLAAAGSRQLSVFDNGNANFLNQSTLELVQGVDTVETAVLLTTPEDAWNGRIGPGAKRIALWQVRGDLTKVGTIIRGRAPRPGEAIVSTEVQRSLGLDEPVGYVTTSSGVQYPVVGAYTSLSPFEDLDKGIVVAAPTNTSGRELRVVIVNISAVRATERAVVGIVAPRNPEDMRVSSPSGLANTARDLGNQLAGFGRSLLLLILAVGAFFVAAVVLADVLVRRRDLGRRRTLGITRSDLTGLVALRSLIPATIGAGLGSVVGLIANGVAGSPTPPEFAAAIAVLSVLAAGLAALPPAIFASRADPVEVMRTA